MAGIRSIVLLSLLVSAAIFPALVHGQDGRTVNLQIIVDQSGSMGAATDTGVMRMDSAKAVLNEVIAQIPDEPGVNVGLRVYGHLGNNQPAGQAESCVSSELLVPMQGVNKPLLTERVNALIPVGWTPLGYALEQAAADFTQPASESVTNAIIMVTDGLETCGADPAAIAGQLKASEAGITTHVIGFGTTADEQAILNGIAQSSGGQLLGSNNAGQLMDALFEILEELDVVEETGSGEARNSPLGIGRIGNVGNYELSVISVTPNATDVVMGYNPYNDPPAVGKQFFMARMSATYTGPDTGTPWLDLNYQAVGSKSVGYSTLNDYCGDYADNPMNFNELFTGGSAEFNLCWNIASEDEGSLVMYVEPLIGGGDGRVWFSLGNPIEVTVDESGTVSTPEPAAEPTAAPTQPPAASTTSSASSGTERTDPLPVGSVGEMNNYEIQVISVTPLANDVVMTENPYNDPPAAGKQFFIARVGVTYTGNDAGTPWIDLSFQAVGPSNLGYTTFNNDCGLYPEDGYSISELFPGGYAEFNVCWEVETTDAPTLVMYVEPFFSSNSDRIWFSLQP